MRIQAAGCMRAACDANTRVHTSCWLLRLRRRWSEYGKGYRTLGCPKREKADRGPRGKARLAPGTTSTTQPTPTLQRTGLLNGEHNIQRNRAHRGRAQRGHATQQGAPPAGCNKGARTASTQASMRAGGRKKVRSTLRASMRAGARKKVRSALRPTHKLRVRATPQRQRTCQASKHAGGRARAKGLVCSTPNTQAKG
jgi:hypothetical protein